MTAMSGQRAASISGVTADPAMVTSVSFPAPASVLSGSPRSDGSHKHLATVLGIPGAANAKPFTQRAGQVVFGVGSVLLIK